MGIDDGDDIYSFHFICCFGKYNSFCFVSVGPAVIVIVNTSGFRAKQATS
jgi:hypothetical protein